MISALLLSLATLSASPDARGPVAAPLPVSVIWNWRSNAPRVRVWLEDDRTFRRGDRARVSFRTEEDAYVTVVRIDTDGRMRIIYPERPSYEHRVAGGRIYSVEGVRDGSFRIDDRAGMGYIFAIASWDRFDFERAYDSPFHQVGYRVRGDPYEAVSSLADEMLPYRDALYSTHAAEYYVDNHRDYPRYSCNECHFGGSHPGHWHPHLHTCPYIRLVIFGGHHHHHYPDYYPYYYYHGRRRVYVRQHRYRPQYEFKEVARGERVRSNDGFIERRTRQVAVDNRRPGSPTSDPNIDRRGGSVTPGAGATRPGASSGAEGATIGTMPGRRSGQQMEGVSTGGSAPGRAGTVPRRAEGTTNAAPERDRGTTIEGGRPRRGEGGSEEERSPAQSGQPRSDGVERSSSDPRRDQPRRGEERSTEPRSDDDRRSAPDGSRPEPRDEPRRSEPRDEPRRAEPRDEPRQAEPRDESRRAEPRDEPRRAEPREEPRRSEPRQAEPRSEPRSEPRRSEPRSEPKARSTETRSSESRGSSGSSRPSNASPRRRP